MEDDYDIYGDLEGFEEEAAQDNKVVHELNAQIAELRERIAEKEHEKQDTIARNTILLENISSLLVTAKAELKRKDAVIADIRRDRDNAAFRRKRNVQRHDQGTQTTLVRLLSREVQTEGEAPSRVVKREREAEWKWERKRVEEDQRRREEERLKVKERVPVRERLGGRVVMSRQQDRKRGRGRNREEERERERQARRGPRSPEVERHPVRFRSPVRVKAEESSVPDSASDIELSRAFIPMNRKELDRYVKEIGREQNRSPVVVEVTKREKIGKPLKDVKGEELWDTRPRKKTKTPKKHRKLVGKTPVKRKSPGIIQSDEIGTTACGSSVLSPVKSEDIEQRMSALHGHPPLPEPPKVVIPPPPEPPIIEDVPELPLEDDAKLNDSRELKIVESSDEQVVQSEPMVEDEQNSSAETVIERSRVEDDVDLEDGEVITPAPSPAPPSKEEIVEAKRIAKIAQAVAQLAQETKIKLEQKETDSPLKTKVKQVKLKRKRADRSPKVEPNPEELPVEVAPPPPKEPTPEQDQQTKHKRNLNGAFELPDQPTTQRRNTFSGALVNDKAKRKPRLSEPGSSKVAATKKTEALHELFGTDDENSFVVAPPPEEEVTAHGKRKRTESAGEVVEGKKSRKVEDATKEDKAVEEDKRSAGTDESESVTKKKVVDESVVEDEHKIIPKDQGDLNSREEQEENEALTQNTTEPDEDIETLKSDSATSVESASTAQSDQQELASGSEPVFNGFDDPKGEADEPTVNQDEDVPKKEEIDDPKHEEAAAAANADEDDKPNHPPETIVVSNKYCEYRIEDDNEVETTFYVTRKKKRKTKSKSRNASLNASGAN